MLCLRSRSLSSLSLSGLLFPFTFDDGSDDDDDDDDDIWFMMIILIMVITLYTCMYVCTFVTCMYICVCLYVYVCMCMYACRHVCKYVYVCVHVCTHVCVCMYLYACMCVCKYGFIQDNCMCIFPDFLRVCVGLYSQIHYCLLHITELFFYMMMMIMIVLKESGSSNDWLIDWLIDCFSSVCLSQSCSGMPGHYPVDECCSDVPFGFWYNFQVGSGLFSGCALPQFPDIFWYNFLVCCGIISKHALVNFRKFLLVKFHGTQIVCNEKFN